MDTDTKEKTTSPADLAIAMTNAMNIRDFDSPLWNNLATNIRCTPQGLSGKMKGIPGQRGFVDSLRELAQRYPTWHIKILSLSTHYDTDEKYAEVFVASDVSGHPPGITRTVMTRIEYRLVEGRWKFFNHELLSGVDMAQDG